jgi:type I restriction enzyme S subunit
MTDQTTTIPKGWKMTTLGEVGLTVTGKTPSKDNPEDWGEFLDFITPTDISTDSKYLETVARKLSNTGAKRFQKMLIPSNSVVVTCIGSDMGKVIMNKNEALTNQQINSIKINLGYDNDYIFYLLRNSYKILRNIAVGGSTMPILNKTTFESLKFLIPPLPEQRAIAAVLSSLDDKIELLREQNKTLEATAQTIFKEWFVRFNFPNENGEPYATAGGKMIDSILGPIPEGWRVGRLGDEVDTILGGTPSTEKKEYWENGTVPWINSGKVNDFRIYKPTAYITEKALNESAAKLMPKGTVVIAITGATLGQVSRLEIESTGNQSVIGIIPNEKFSSAYLFYWMLENISKIINTATGGAQQHINKNDVNAFDFVIPTDGLLKNHHAIVNPMLEKISSNCFQIQTLSTLRDTLLPKLMKGEVRVKSEE